MNEEVLGRLSEIDEANVVRCARLLLRRPFLRAGGPDEEMLPLVYRYRSTLTELFAQLLGYRLVVERRFARLHKAGPGADPTRCEPTLSPRGYVYLALCLAELIGLGQQTLLSRLVVAIRAAAGEVGITVTEELPELRAIAAALRYLVALGVLTETEGSVSDLVAESSAEALLTIDTTLLAHVVIGPIGAAQSPTEFVKLAARPGARGLEHAVRRRLVENPVTLYAELSDEEANWLRAHSRQESRLLERCLGLVTETRLEGIVMTDPEDELTDLVFPGNSTISRVALLALPQLLTGANPDHYGRTPTTDEQITKVCSEIVNRYPDAWSKQAVANTPKLVDDVLHLWRALGLAQPAETGLWLINPCAYRWAPTADDAPRTVDDEPAPAAAVAPAWSLFPVDGKAQ